MVNLRIGFGRADITPPLGTPMIGYFHNGKTPRTAQSVYDPLYASARVVRIKHESPIQPTFVVELVNGCVGYVPTKEAHANGGYDTILSRTSKLVPEAGDVRVGTALLLLREIAG